MLVKVCGLTMPEEAEYLKNHQVDLAGMVLFFPKSKRNITLDRAKEIMSALGTTIKKVAVVVAPDEEQLEQIAQAGFDYVQIHGDLDLSMAHRCKIPILKAFNGKDMDSLERYQKEDQIIGYVFDAQEPGSGKPFDWNVLQKLPRDQKLFLLAGGLCPENVAEAIRRVAPDGVDVSSGVERSDGPGKDVKKIACFVKQAKGSS